MAKISNYTTLGYLVNALAAADVPPPSVDDVIRLAEAGELASAINEAAKATELAPNGIESSGIVIDADMSQALGSQANVWDRRKFFLSYEEPNGWHAVLDWIFSQIQTSAGDADATWSK